MVYRNVRLIISHKLLSLYGIQLFNCQSSKTELQVKLKLLYLVNHDKKQDAIEQCINK
jgi:hypothetical protein